MLFRRKRIRSIFSTHIRLYLPAKAMLAAGLVLIILSLFAIGSSVQADMPEVPLGMPFLQGAAEGKVIFDEKCAGCHTIGGGKLVGPDLKDITQQRELQWIKDFILDPASMIASDADAQQLYEEYNNFPMPNMGLTVEQVDQVVEYISNPSEIADTPPSSDSTNAGDPAVGRHLFTGEMALKNGGPSCISCHAASGAGTIGGGLGPDLTKVIERFGEPGLAAALKTLPFPTMIGPFQNHPLTPEEQADFVAFFKESNQSQDPVAGTAPGALTPPVLWFFAFGLAFAAVLFGILGLLWIPLKKRYQTYLPVRNVGSSRNR
jgi:mono/diheme cytochrome c family protein